MRPQPIDIEDKKIKRCIPAGTHENFNSPGDDYVYYPLSERDWRRAEECARAVTGCPVQGGTGVPGRARRGRSPRRAWCGS